MTIFRFEVFLVSGLIDFAWDTPFGTDPIEAFDYDFYNHGGTESLYEAYPILKPGLSSLSKESSFAGLSWDPEFEQFEGSTPSYEIQTSSEDENSGMKYSYRLLINFSAQTSANSLQEATDKVRSEASNCLLIYDGGIDETLEVEDVRLVLTASSG